MGGQSELKQAGPTAADEPLPLPCPSTRSRVCAPSPVEPVLHRPRPSEHTRRSHQIFHPLVRSVPPTGNAGAELLGPGSNDKVVVLAVAWELLRRLLLSSGELSDPVALLPAWKVMQIDCTTVTPSRVRASAPLFLTLF